MALGFFQCHSTCYQLWWNSARN